MDEHWNFRALQALLPGPPVSLALPLNSSRVPALTFLHDFTLALCNPWGTPLHGAHLGSSPRTHVLEAFQGAHPLVRASPWATHTLCMGTVPQCRQSWVLSASPPSSSLGLHLCVPVAFLHSLTWAWCAYRNEVHLAPCS